MLHPRRNSAVLASLLAAAAASAATQNAQADSASWISPAGGNWIDPANWSAPYPNATTDTATFGPAITNFATISLDAPITVGGLSFATTLPITLSGTTPNNLTFGASGSPVSIDVATLVGTHVINAPSVFADDVTMTGGGFLLFSSAISSSGTLTVNTTGSLRLTADNAAWTPSTIVVQSGILSTSGGLSTSLGNASSGSVEVQGGGSLNINGLFTSSTGTIFTKPLTIAGDGVPTAQGALFYYSPSTAALRSPVTLNGDASIYVDYGTIVLGTATGTGSLSGTGVLTKRGSGTIQLSLRSAHSGGIAIAAGLLQINNTGSLVGTGNITVTAGGSLQISRGSGTSNLTASVSPNSVALQDGTLILGANLDPGTILSSSSSTGENTILLTTANFDAGGTNVLDFSPMSAQFRLGASPYASIAPAVSLIPHATTHTLLFGGRSGTLDVKAPLADVAGTPTKVDLGGPGYPYLGLYAINTYTGGATVNSGTLFVAASGSLVGTGEIVLNAGTTLEIVKPAGAVPASASVSPNTVIMHAATIHVAADISVANLISPASTGTNTLAIETPTFTAGGTNIIDLSAAPFTRIASFGYTTIASSVSIIPDLATHTLRFGGYSSGSLTVAANLQDVGGTPTHVESIRYGPTVFTGPNTYTGITTVNGDLQIGHAQGLGVGTGVDADGTVINTYGVLRTSANIFISGEKITLNGGSLYANTNTPIYLAAKSAIHQNTTQGPISGPADLILSNATIKGNNTYTGQTTISGSVEVYSYMGLGDAATGTTVPSGNTLYLMSDVQEPLTVSGTLYLYGIPYTMPVSMTGGTLRICGDLQTPLSISGKVYVEPWGSGAKIAGTTGNGTLRLNAAQFLTVTAPPLHTGDVFIGGNCLTLAAPMTVPNLVTFDGGPGRLTIDADVTLANLRPMGGTIVVNPGYTLTLPFLDRAIAFSRLWSILGLEEAR